MWPDLHMNIIIVTCLQPSALASLANQRLGQLHCLWSVADSTLWVWRWFNQPLKRKGSRSWLSADVNVVCQILGEDKPPS